MGISGLGLPLPHSAGGGGVRPQAGGDVWTLPVASGQQLRTGQGTEASLPQQQTSWEWSKQGPRAAPRGAGCHPGISVEGREEGGRFPKKEPLHRIALAEVGLKAELVCGYVIIAGGLLITI